MAEIFGIPRLSAVPMPGCVKELRSGTYTSTGTVLVTYREEGDSPSFFRLATVNDDGSDFHPFFARDIPTQPGANGIRFMIFADGKRILLGDWIIECKPDMDHCEKAECVPLLYPPISDQSNPNAMRWSEIIVSPSCTHMAWTALNGFDGATNRIGRLVRKEDHYELADVKIISTLDFLVPDEAHPGTIRRGVVRGGELKQFIRGGLAVSEAGIAEGSRIADSVIQDLDGEGVRRITRTACYDETTIFSPDERLGMVMTTRFSPKTNCAVLAWLPRPFMSVSLRGTTLPVYMLSVAAGRSTPGVNIGPALIDIRRSMQEELYMGADLSDPEGKWVYHSPMSWHPSSKKALWVERTYENVLDADKSRLRIVELPDYQPGAPVAAVDVPTDIPYAIDPMEEKPKQPLRGPVHAVGMYGGTFEMTQDGQNTQSIYDHYSEDGLTTYNGTETFTRDAGGCTYEAHVNATGKEAGEMNLRLRFLQPNMWSMAKVDFSIAEDGKPASYGTVTWQGKTLNVDIMKE